MMNERPRFSVEVVFGKRGEIDRVTVTHSRPPMPFDLWPGALKPMHRTDAGEVEVGITYPSGETEFVIGNVTSRGFKDPSDG